MRTRHRGPGPKKVEGYPWVRRHDRTGWWCADYRIRELFERADVMSEGANRNDGPHPTYYGTTDILLGVSSRGGPIPEAWLDELSRLLPCDPHARLRALRIACREAHVRAGTELGRVTAELSFSRSVRGLHIHVEVEAIHGARGRQTA